MMDRRIGLRIGGALAAVTCSLLVACGGGGGGGGSTIPSTGGGGATPTPIPATQSASVTTSTSSATSLSLGAIASGPSAAVVSFPLTSVATTASIVEQSTLPSSAGTVPQAKAMLHPATLGSTPTVISYFVVQVNPSVTISSSPGFQLTLTSALSAGYADIVYYTGATQGWVSLTEIPVAAGATTLNFPAATLSPPATLAASTPYVFAVVTSAHSLVPGPTNSPTTSPTSTASSAPTLAPGTAPTLPPPGSAASLGWGAYDVANAFRFPVQSGYNGQGQTVAIVGDEVPQTSDFQTYLSTFGIVAPIYSGTFTVKNVGTGPVPGDTGGLQEASLDIETVMGLAPGANILFYAIPDLSDQSFIDAYNQIQTDGLAKIVSLSFGGCEQYNGSNYTSSDHPILATMANAGIYVVASSGDQGNECFTGAPAPAPTYSPGANYPASDPNVIGVGGTQTNLSITATTAWNDSVGASGGNVSFYFTPPPSQIGLTSFASQSRRNVPDIALPAVSVAVRFDGGAGTTARWAKFDGTSWSAPQTAALLSELFEYCGGPIPASFSSPQGLFYTAYGRSHALFSDVMTGNNQFSGDPNDLSGFYSAGPGPDNVSGLGLPYGADIAASICANHTPQMRLARSSFAMAQGYGPAQAMVLDNVPHVPGLRDLGERAASQQTRVVLVVRANASAASDVQTVANALRVAGFTIESASGMVVDASAPAATVASYFRTGLHDYAQGGSGTRYSNTSAVTVPAAIAPYVSGVVSNNLIVARHFLHPHVQ